ncbi:MAG: TetR/AcrR family transcriptional regulator [Deltaproteobacteria bacterium]|nr:TetR/AcrR family transcriptional regulator [Deltaproteobacteria bacterium]MBW2392638.1 TetR/AcrR family transcriptional regulator [Deltaproteobacteria bacterium]
MAARSTRTHDPQDTRAAIVRAALELMSERSYDGTAVPDVAARAGVAAGTMYRHFKGKEALVNAVYRECKLSMHRFLIEAIAGAPSPREGFRRLWRGLWEFSRKHSEAFRFLEMHRHLPYLEPASREVSNSVMEGVATFVRSAQAEGAIREGPPEVLIALAFGAFVGLAKESEAGLTRLDEETIALSEEAVWGLLAA